MCRFISFKFKPIKTLPIRVYSLVSHSDTDEELKLNHENEMPNQWRDGHYLPDETIECNTLEIDDLEKDECATIIKDRFPSCLSFLEWCCENGANINAKNCNNITVLHYAAGSGKKEIVELLIVKGADVKAKYKDGRTVLHSAAARGSKELFELLIAKGADVNAKDNDNRTVLYWAAVGGNKEIAELLKKHGAK